MSTTLTNGLKLPDKGSVDWYADMQNNYAILDGAVGTIAAHTSALAGKAPAVHTHTKSDITDFPAYGTTAGTICEGNDSRLSDARTPVAHTHTKSDVTDLLNSNFIPSANNSYDLGSSSYQWNNLYANNYYYNGTPWGLDKANVWTENNSYRKDVILSNSSIQVGVTPTSSRSSYLYFNDNYGSTIGYLRDRVYTSGETQMHLSVHNKYSNGALDINGSDVQGDLYLGIKSNGTTFISVNSNSVIPTTTSVTDLGSTDNKWKTLNGINPGALSLPDYNNCLDVTSEIPIASLNGNTQIDINNYLPNKTGWLSIVIADTAGNFIVATQGRLGGSTAYNNSRTFHTGAQSNGYISVFFPILADMNKFVSIKASSLIQMRFYYCLGNV